MVLMSSLRDLYIEELEKNGFPNPNYRGEKLKARLENASISQQIAFTVVDSGNQDCITHPNLQCQYDCG